MEKRQCWECDIKKPLTEFYKRSNTQDGYLSKCKDCLRKKQREDLPKPLPKPKSYTDYLKEAGMYEYYKRTAQYRSFM